MNELMIPPTLKSKAELLVYEQKAIEKKRAKLYEETAEVWFEFLKEYNLNEQVSVPCSLFIDNIKQSPYSAFVGVGELNYDKRLNKLLFTYICDTNTECTTSAIPEIYGCSLLTEQMYFVYQNYKPYTKGE